MDQIDPLARVLRACARIDLDDGGHERLLEAAHDVREWRMLPLSAEDHGVSPLVRRHLKRCGIALPDTVSRQLTAMAVRHRDASRAQSAALLEIVDALDAAGMAHVVLKGAILALDLYPVPELRPRRDIDILVARGDASRARALLRAIGFEGPAGESGRPGHHHLPALGRDGGGYHVSVELHVDAISRDQPGSLTLDTMSPPREIHVGGRRLRAFGHPDMLRHLGAHVLQPRSQTRLLGVTDLVEYAARHAADIDWDSIRRVDPRTLNILSVMDYVTPLPAVLDAIRPRADARPPEGAGRGLPPLRTLASMKSRARHTVSAVLYPPEWWMRAYYNVPPGAPLFPARWGRHVWRVAYWALRRSGGS